MQTAATVIGFIAIAASVMIYQQKTRPRLLAAKAISDVFWILHYLLLGAYTGAAVTGVALARSLVFFKNDSRNTKSRIILGCFLAISIASGILTWKNGFSIFAMAGSFVAIISFWIGNPRLSRILMFPVSVCFLIYGVANGSVAALINEVLVMLSSILGILRHDRKKQEVKQ